MLARLLDALAARRDVPGPLCGWAERAAAGGFASLAACLDELERTGTEAAVHAGSEPPGLSGIFADDELDALERAASRVPGRRRRIAAAVAGAVVATLTGLALVDPGGNVRRVEVGVPAQLFTRVVLPVTGSVARVDADHDVQLLARIRVMH